jgi:TonB family protein
VKLECSKAGYRRAFSAVGFLPFTGGVVSMRSRWTRKVLASAGATLLLGAIGFAQTASTDEGKRKVKSRVAPAYPELAKRMNVTGKVKIEVIIAPDGHVKSTRAVGGHPLLVQACQDAVKEWKFLPAPEESTQVVEFDFTGSSN